LFFNLQRWSLHDGPGIRTTVFFKGCPLRCQWCSNPESWSFHAQLVFMKDKCSGCGTCIDVCPAYANSLNGSKTFYDRNMCTLCGCCVDACPEHTRALVGQELSIDEIVEAIEKDAVFYRASDGGVTFSGGEPFAQMEVLRQLARKCTSAGIHTAVETSGFFSLKDASDIFEYIDEIFIDLKHTNERRHLKLTGVSNQKILANIKRLDELGRGLTIRIPLIEGLTDTSENIEGVVKFCARLENLITAELIPYHNFGMGKYPGLDLPYDDRLRAPGRKTIHLIIDQLNAHGIAAQTVDTTDCRS